MAPSGVANSDGAPAAIVVRGLQPASIGQALRDLRATVGGHAVVLARLAQPAPVSPLLVDAVVDALVEAGCDVTVGMTLGTAERDRGHRSISALAHTAGLTGRTQRGRHYRVADFAEDTIVAPVPAASVLAGAQVSRLWAEAGARVVLGRAVTDLADTYAAELATLLGAAREVPGAQDADVATDLLRYLPPAVAVVDALAVSDGADGARILGPAAARSGDHAHGSNTVVVATDALQADCVVATLLGVDRASSRLVDQAIGTVGAPTGRVEGDLTPFEGIRRPHPLATAAFRRVGAYARLTRVVRAATGGPDEGAHPVDSVLATLRTLLTPAVTTATDSVGQTGLVALLGAVSSVSQGTQGWTVSLDKSRIDRVVVPLGFDADGHPDDEYDQLPAFFAPFDAIIEALPEAAAGVDAGMRWCLVDGATVFEVSRVIAADFDDFVARVDVAAGISLMADYIGGRRVRVGSEASPRQAERNLYLPQPNYLAAWGANPIDVCKIELVERDPDQHRLLWRTVKSPNGSAEYDDGTLTFTRTGGPSDPGGSAPASTTVSIRGRQLFTLPPAWATVDLAALPEVRGPLLEEAYRRFFTTTFDNLEACFEGRDFSIGRPPPNPEEPLLTESLQLLIAAAGDWLHTGTAQGDSADSADSGAGERRDQVDGMDEVDVHGFRHVGGRR